MLCSGEYGRTRRSFADAGQETQRRAEFAHGADGFFAGLTVEQIAEQEGVAHQNVSKSIRQAKKKIKFFFEKQGAKVPF